jgi:hypothetical protein
MLEDGENPEVAPADRSKSKGGQGAEASALDATGSPGSSSGGNFGPRLRRRIVNANLQHRKPSFQFAGSIGGAFYRDELRF